MGGWGGGSFGGGVVERMMVGMQPGGCKEPMQRLNHIHGGPQSHGEGRSGSGARDEQPGLLGAGGWRAAAGMQGASPGMAYHPIKGPPSTSLPQGAWEWDSASFTLQLMGLYPTLCTSRAESRVVTAPKCCMSAGFGAILTGLFVLFFLFYTLPQRKELALLPKSAYN